MLVVPVGGGGCIGGCAVAAKAINPRILVVGAEPVNADDAYRSLEAGKRILLAGPPSTIADGLRTSLGDLTFPIIKHNVDRIVRVTEKELIDSMVRCMWLRCTRDSFLSAVDVIYVVWSVWKLV